MTDIIERLRNRALAAAIIKDKPDLYNDAADAIIRLRAENETLRRDVKTAVMGDSAELADVKRENEKIRAALEDVIAAVHCTRSSIGVAIIDIEPISAARKALKESGE